MTQRTLVHLVLCALLWLPVSQAFALDWKEIYTDDGVTVSKASVEGSKLVAFKGDTVMDAPPGKVLAVLLDNEHRVEWVGRLYVNTPLSQPDPFNYVVYQAFALPAFFSDRDYVYQARATQAPSGEVTLHMASAEHADAPETVGVRADLVNSRYLLTPVDGGKTRVEVEIVTDPMGSMPAWLVNLIQRSWPKDTLSGIREQLAKPWVTEHALPPVGS